MRKIGIFGGTFDPVHNAHIAIAKAAYEQLGLDFVIMMTGGNPPHKRDMHITDARIRHIMLKLAVKNEPELIASDWEINRDEYSYSVNTLRFFKALYPDDEIYFIIGGDSLENLKSWYEPEQICKLCTLAVYSRGKKADLAAVRREYNARTAAIKGDFLDISSTALRRERKLLNENVPEKVCRFIEKYGLYRPQEADMDILKRLLKPSRLSHSIGVAEFAKRLAVCYGADADAAYRAGLLHDAAKNIDYAASVEMCDELEAQLDPIERTLPPLVHPKLGAELVKCLFGLSEGEITSAIRWHTVGRVGMTLMDKIIFVADMCEEGRSFDGVGQIRNMAFDSLDTAAIMCINATISYNKRLGGTVHPCAYAVREDLMKNL